MFQAALASGRQLTQVCACHTGEGAWPLRKWRPSSRMQAVHVSVLAGQRTFWPDAFPVLRLKQHCEQASSSSLQECSSSLRARNLGPNQG